jgi:hypothetical protein
MGNRIGVRAEMSVSPPPRGKRQAVALAWIWASSFAVVLTMMLGDPVWFAAAAVQGVVCLAFTQTPT